MLELKEIAPDNHSEARRLKVCFEQERFVSKDS